MDELEATRAFVRDVDRARRGEPISGEKKEAKTKPQAAAKKQAAKEAPHAKNAPAPKNATESKTPAKKDDTQQSSAALIGKSKKSKNSKKEPKDPPMPQEVEPKPAPPPKGKAKFDCGCFGTLHGALTNCLYCGRIACEREGYGFCPFCGYLVEEVKSSGGGDPYVLAVNVCFLPAILTVHHGDLTCQSALSFILFSFCRSSTDEAWKHKERLLRYDQEFAQRTVILDDQADYFNNQMSMWSTDEERAEAARQEQQRQDDIHKRKMQMNLGL